MSIFLFQKKKYKKHSKQTWQSILTTSCLHFPSQIYYFSSNWNKNGVEVALYCSTKKRIPNQMQNVYNHTTSEIHTSFQSFSPADSF